MVTMSDFKVVILWSKFGWLDIMNWDGSINKVCMFCVFLIEKKWAFII